MDITDIIWFVCTMGVFTGLIVWGNQYDFFTDLINQVLQLGA